ncbi:MAG: hypothetical protein M1840_000026 [Geoglossum simile]|nr:MAG: hypothetical protein M1840_000026 [Geoglossum simile]
MSDPVGKPTTLIPIEGVFKPPAKKSKKASTKWQFYQPPVYEYDEKSKAKKRYRPSQSYLNTQRYDTENSREQESVNPLPTSPLLSPHLIILPLLSHQQPQQLTSTTQDKRSKEELTFAKALLKHATRVEFDLKGLANEFRYHPDFTKVVFLRFYNSWGCVFRHNAGAGVPASNFVLGNSGENPFSVPAQGSSGSTPISVPLPPPPPPASGDNGWAPDLVAGLDYEPGELFASPPLPGSVPGTPGPIPGPPGVGDGLVSCMPTPVSSDVVAVPSPFYADRTGDMLLTDPVLNEGGWRDNPFDENYDWDNSEPSTYSHPVRPFSGLMWRDGYDVGN